MYTYLINLRSVLEYRKKHPEMNSDTTLDDSEPNDDSVSANNNRCSESLEQDYCGKTISDSKETKSA